MEPMDSMVSVSMAGREVSVRNSRAPAKTERMLTFKKMAFQESLRSALRMNRPWVHMGNSCTSWNMVAKMIHSGPRIEVTSGMMRLPLLE